MKHVFIVGSKGIPANYGGFETFVDKLTEYHQNDKELKYHVACRSLKSKDSFLYHNADCFYVKVPNIGAAQAIWYDVAALFRVCNYIEEHKIPDPIVYILTCRIGIFAPYFQKRIQKAGGQLFLNPDGHEWKRSKWPLPVRLYWKFSEAIMVHFSDLVICDSKAIEQYIRKTYHKGPEQTTYLSYGAEVNRSNDPETDGKLEAWLQEKRLTRGKYYLSVGRFVPENNYEIMIREFMATDSDNDYAIITTADDRFKQTLEDKIHFSRDPRIKFVGTVYDPSLLKRIREEAYAGIHGHEVGGTNPSLLEALGSTRLNLLLDVAFNREVAKDAALYWNKTENSLAELIGKADTMIEPQFDAYQKLATDRIREAFNWNTISGQYKELFLQRGL